MLSAGSSSCPAALPQQFVYEAAVVLVGSRRGDVFTARGCEVLFVRGPSEGIAQSYKRDTDPFQI